MAAKLTALQFFFALTWIVYVIYLPALAAQAGIDKRYVPMILMMDQAIFIACDWAAGVYADRVARVLGRIGGRMAMVTLASCAAFIALPWIAPGLGAITFLVVTAFWSATSSALRAPPLALVSRHAPTPQQPRMAAMYLLGLGLATATAPFLGITLKGVDPRWPFALASIALAVFAIAMARAESGSSAVAAEPNEGVPDPLATAPLVAFALTALVFGVGFQVHFSINTAAQYARFASADELPWLMPLFWVGFNLALVPASLLSKRFGGADTMVVAGAIGVAALVACAVAPMLEVLIAAQLVAGAAWGVTLWAAFAAALDAGRPGREGLVTGVLFSMLAGAALARLAAVSWGLPALPQVPPYAWAAGALLAGVIALRRVR